VVLLVALADGDHHGALRVGSPARCVDLDVAVQEGVRTVLAVDASRLDPCDPDEAEAGDAGIDDDDAGFPDAGFPDAGFPDAGFPDAGFPDAGPDPLVGFVAAVLIDQEPLCVGDDCDLVTRVDADGNVTVTPPTGPVREGTLLPLDLAALAAQILGGDADALFAGDDPLCPQEDLDGAVLLRRELDPDVGEGDDVVTHEVDISDCAQGTAQELRLRLLLARMFAS
jgi:hypothetical protein